MNYEIRIFDWEDIENLYNTYMQEDFPKSELRPINKIKEAYDDNRNRTFALYEEGRNRLMGYAIYEKPLQGDIWLMDYYAINKNVRGKGIGTMFLKLIKNTFTEAEAAIGEIERIDKAANDEEREIRTRRKQFYLNNGFCETGIFTMADDNVDYEILCFPINRKIVGREAVESIKKIYETFFNEGEYKVFDYE